MKKTNSVLISFPGYPATPSSFLPDNGLANLAGALLESGHETQIWDYGVVDTMDTLKTNPLLLRKSQELNAELFKNKSIDLEFELLKLSKDIEEENRASLDRLTDSIVSNLGRVGPDFIGLKLWNGDGFTGSIMIAEKLRKQFPQIKIFAGGPHADWFMYPIMQVTKSIDALCYAEGEKTIVGLADSIHGKTKLNEISNLILSNGTITPIERIMDLTSLPLPVYDPSVYLAMSQPNQKIKIFMLDETRGCPNICNFCVQPIKSGNNYRVNSRDYNFRVIEQIKKLFGTNTFRFAGSNTLPDVANSFAEALINHGINIEYGLFGELQGFSKETLTHIYESGARTMFFGLESGSPNLLKNIHNKPTNMQEKAQILGDAMKSGLYTIASCIYPNPGETVETTKETLSFLSQVNPDAIPLAPPGVMPRTLWGTEPQRFGVNLEPDYERKLMEYKIKLLLPASSWDPLPYTIDGKNSSKLFEELGQFTNRLEQEGHLANFSDDLFLISRQSGLEPREFRDTMRTILLSGDSDSMRSYVGAINKSLKEQSWQ